MRPKICFKCLGVGMKTTDGSKTAEQQQQQQQQHLDLACSSTVKCTAMGMREQDSLAGE